MRHILSLAALAAAAAAAPALAAEDPAEAPMAALTERMADPEQQRETALMLQTMAEVLLDMPIAPLANAAAEMAGDTAARVPPDATLRRIAPGAGEVAGQIGKRVPQMMGAMAQMGESFARMAPLLAEMAGRMRAAMPQAD